MLYCCYPAREIPRVVRGSLLSGDFYVQKLTSAIISAGAANVVRENGRLTVRTFTGPLGGKSVMGPALIPD